MFKKAVYTISPVDQKTNRFFIQTEITSIFKTILDPERKFAQNAVKNRVLDFRLKEPNNQIKK